MYNNKRRNKKWQLVLTQVIQCMRNNNIIMIIMVGDSRAQNI